MFSMLLLIEKNFKDKVFKKNIYKKNNNVYMTTANTQEK